MGKIGQTLLALALASTAARGDWLVFRGGEVREIRGAWELGQGQVRFTAVNGALMSVRASEVDLALSVFF